MKIQKKVEESSLYLTQVLADYEVIPANWGWHIHKEDKYCGYLEYQNTSGWQGSALNSLPNKLRESLQKFAKSGFSRHSNQLQQQML
jgi:hypothetical protein